MADPSEIELLHHRYQQQANWTRSIRNHLLENINLPPMPQILEVGCGTGVILSEIQIQFPGSACVGIDIDRKPLALANTHRQDCVYTQADALELPFETNCFDLVICHFFLLWAKPLEDIFKEITRVLKMDSPFIAFAEPDYGGRIDYPTELASLGHWQEQALQHQGAHTRVGRELAYHFSNAGLENITSGVLGGEWEAKPTFNEEEETFLRDLENSPAVNTMKLKHLFEIDHSARERGTRILFVTTFYAIGWKQPTQK